MSVYLTAAAVERVQRYLEKRGSGIGLRLGVKRTGCSGYMYVIDYADEVNEDDIVFDDQPVKVIVDQESLKVIDGTQVDFVKEGLAEMFRFRNPRAVGECGCGESFTIDEPEGK